MSLAPNMDGCTWGGGHPAPGSASGRIAAGGMEIAADIHRVTVSGIHVPLSPTGFRLLLFFATHAERVHSRRQLLDQVWIRKVLVGVRTVDVHIRRLRAALEPFGLDGLIQTVHGSGYRFSCIRNDSGKWDAELVQVPYAVLGNTVAHVPPAVLD